MQMKKLQTADGLGTQRGMGTDKRMIECTWHEGREGTGCTDVCLKSATMWGGWLCLVPVGDSRLVWSDAYAGCHVDPTGVPPKYCHCY